ncbi:MAG: pyrimidine utilization protein B [Thalassobaculales bacterium]
MTALPFERRRAALLAIDLQGVFCRQDGAIGRQPGRDMAACAAAAGLALELVAAARQAGMPVIWTRHVLRDDYADGGLLTGWLRPGLKAIGALRASDPETALIATPAAADTVIDKPRFSAFHATPLDAVLRARGIDSLLVCGVTTSMCVESTVRDAGQRDYAVLVVREACADFDAARHEASLAAIAFGFGRVIGFADAMAILA